MKPDVMAPGDEITLLGANQRMTAPTTCTSTDDDQAAPVECARLLPGAFFPSTVTRVGTACDVTCTFRSREIKDGKAFNGRNTPL